MSALAHDVRTLCEDSPELFHAPDQEAPAAKRAREAEAKAICFACPDAVRESCLQIAMEAERGLSAGNRNGIYGGLTEKERAELDDTENASAIRCDPCGRDFPNAGSYRAHETWAHDNTTLDDIRRLARAGYNDRQIADELRMNQKTVFAIRARNNIPPAMPVQPKKEAS